ncbi:hypothetical protein ACRC6Q_16595 [Planococcus sp. SE5232]
MFYRHEDGQEVWQFVRYRAAGIKWMLKNGWRKIDWINEEE